MAGRAQIPDISGNRVDVRVAPDGTKRAVCNLIAFSQFSVPSSDPSSSNSMSLNPSNYENAFAIDLAIRHLNERNGSIIKEIEKMDGTCNIEFAVEYIDTEDDAVTAAKRVTSRLDASEDEERYSPCALIGATSSFSESIQTGIVANMKGYSIVSGMNHGTVLSHKKNFPRFARTIPSNFGPASALIQYAHEELGYGYLVILRADTNHSNDYVASIRNALDMYYPQDFVVREILVRQDGSNVQNAIARVKELRITTVVPIFEGIEYSSNLYDVVMEEAYQQGVAGDGTYVWFFPESVLEYSLYLQQLRTPEKYHESNLFYAYRGAGIIKSGRLESKYYELVDGIMAQSESLGHAEYMQSVLPNPFLDTNSNATGDMMSEDTFLNKKNLDSRIQFLYEATALLGLSACDASTDDLYLSGTDLYDTLVRYNYSGISGNVTLDEVSGSRIHSSTDYSVMNVQAISFFGIELRHTTSIKNEGLISVEPFVYNDGTTAKPVAVYKTMLETDLGNSVLIVITSICCIVAALCPVVCAIWTFRNRHTRIVRASQTFFLYLICLGNFLIALTVAPLILFANVEMNAVQGKISATMTVWFFFIGFSMITSSFYCKLRRINKIMNGSKHFKRVAVRVRDVILPVIVTLFLNILILSLMTAFVPPRKTLETIAYDRFQRRTKVYQWPDFWSTDYYKAYTGPLIAVNCGIFLLAGYEGWKARNLSTEFQENDSILRAIIASFFCASICFPVLSLTSDIKVRTFAVTVMISMFCISIQGFLFGEKYLYQKKRTSRETRSDESQEFIEEKVFSRTGRQGLAMQNQILQKQLTESQKQIEQLRSLLAKSLQADNKMRVMTEETQQGSDDFEVLSLSQSMRPIDRSKRSETAGTSLDMTGRSETVGISFEMKDHAGKEGDESETFSLSGASLTEVRNVRLYSQWGE
eukprot:CAMPEP_0116123586 /NCGR_PEP_ID=MMETSP0329-20121206/4826_1 /TAXON_ID=697910 /ORGANISM="Pseudo-nitzschia arenysensis, Strain B593" /LENGTH=929 /DNA_ID=CAMNT_0003617509 /DNA_START=189 /DNA_END=2978 /DNA_ORIENTATION=-